jgi:DNA-binding transcriptional LysR family regulator
VYEARSMELRHLRYFVAVAEELHFGRAAARLGMAQPPLSHQIRRLEEELGVTLLDRTKRRVELTAAGRTFLADARRVLGQAERAMRTAQQASRGEIGHLAIGFVPSADLDILPQVLSVWGARFPHVDLELRALTRCRQVDALRNGRIHVGFVFLPIDDEGLTVEPIQRQPLVAALPERHPLARHPRVRVADLQGEALISFSSRTSESRYDMVVSACQRAGFAPRLLHGTDRIQTNLALIAAGLGVTLLPASVRNLQRTGVVYRALKPPVPHVVMALAHVRGETSPIVTTFVQVVREVTGTRMRPQGAAGVRSA